MISLLRCCVVVSSVVIVSLVPVVDVFAVSQPTLKIQIVAPECMLDTIDDGVGPVQVITCPPSLSDPNAPAIDSSGNSTSAGTTSNGESGQSTVTPQVSQRFQSPADTVTLLKTLRDLGVTLDLPQSSGLSYGKLPDVAVTPRTNASSNKVEQNVLVGTAVVTGSVGAATALHVSGITIGLAKGSGLTRLSHSIRGSKGSGRLRRFKKKP